MFKKVMSVEQFGDEDRAVIGEGDDSVLILRLDDGYAAIRNMCTHEKWPLSDSECVNGVIECDLHGAQYCVKTGKALRTPARTPLRTFPIKLENGEIYLDLETTE